MESILHSFLDSFRTEQEKFDASEAAIFDGFEREKLIEQQRFATYCQRVDVGPLGELYGLKKKQPLSKKHGRGGLKAVEVYEDYFATADEEVLPLISTFPSHDFAGKIMIQSREVAMRVAQKFMADNGPKRLVLWVDGSFGKAAGAGVVFKLPNQGTWMERGYGILHCTGSSGSELVAVSVGLNVALGYVKEREKGSPRIKEVNVFTDSQGTLRRLCSLASKSRKEEDLRVDMTLVKLIAASQQLKYLGIRLVLHWVPGHSKVRGNQRAHKTACRARKRLEKRLLSSLHKVTVGQKTCEGLDKLNDAAAGC